MKKRILITFSTMILGLFSLFFVGCAEKPHVHNFASVVTDSTCTEEGYTTYTCDCGEKYIGNFTEKREHEYTNLIVEATCTKEGFNGKICSNCSLVVKENVIEKLNHNFKTIVINPTCTEEGYTTYTCDCGETYKGDIVEKKGHVYSNIKVEPTCDKDGFDGKICSTCSFVIKENTIEKLEHDYKLQSIILSDSSVKNSGRFKCIDCSEEKIDTINVNDINMPILCFDGDISEMSKENKVLLSVNYDDGVQQIECDATLKWQGASSINYPKKNYTMQLLKKDSDKKNKVEINTDWGKQSKYCLKANYIDYSQSRNVVSGKIYNEIVHLSDLNDEVQALKNGGVVDGFPILIFINGEYQGLYTLNIPKDKWMLGMEDDEEDDDIVTKQALLMGDTWSDGTRLSEEISNDYVSSGFELEYCSTEDTIGDSWVVESWNNMINFINNNDGESFKNGISQYVNIERTIDSMLYTWFILAEDNFAKNILWVTYDGVHWFSSMYDMDGTWGCYWSGETTNNPEIVKEQYLIGNVLWQKIYNNFHNEVVKRYFELRLTVLSKENLINKFTEFDNKIPEIIRETEKLKWTEVPSMETNNLNQIIDFINKRCKTLDEYMMQFII